MTNRQKRSTPLEESAADTEIPSLELLFSTEPQPNETDNPDFNIFGISNKIPKELLKDLDIEENDPNAPWQTKTCLAEYTTNAYGVIGFLNENAGQNTFAIFSMRENV